MQSHLASNSFKLSFIFAAAGYLTRPKEAFFFSFSYRAPLYMTSLQKGIAAAALGRALAGSDKAFARRAGSADDGCRDTALRPCLPQEKLNFSPR